MSDDITKLLDTVKKEHTSWFHKEPIIIGLWWSNMDRLIANIQDAIVREVPYNEYNQLSVEEKREYENGNLVF